MQVILSPWGIYEVDNLWQTNNLYYINLYDLHSPSPSSSSSFNRLPLSRLLPSTTYRAQQLTQHFDYHSTAFYKPSAGMFPLSLTS